VHQLVNEQNFDNIKMHDTSVKTKNTDQYTLNLLFPGFTGQTHQNWNNMNCKYINKAFIELCPCRKGKRSSYPCARHEDIRENGGTALFILNLSRRCGEWSAARHDPFYHRRNPPLTFDWETWWPPELVWRRANLFSLKESQLLECPAPTLVRINIKFTPVLNWCIFTVRVYVF
jgi:hypothetical protein